MWFNVIVNRKGLEANLYLEETPNPVEEANKPLKTEKLESKRVDINVLKARAKAIQDKQNIKNTISIIFILVSLGAVGIYFSI